MYKIASSALVHTTLTLVLSRSVKLTAYAFFTSLSGRTKALTLSS